MISVEGEEFFFGLATAPARVEDRLNDAWLLFAEGEPSDALKKEGLQPEDALMGMTTADGGSQQAPLPSKEVNKRGNKRKPLKMAVQAMLRWFQKYTEEKDDREEITAANEEVHHKVAAWHNVPHRPGGEATVWFDPDTELKLARGTGKPVKGLKETVYFAALERYKWIINRLLSYGMKMMLTLFHHSLPPCAGEYGGWKLEKTVDYFMDFTSTLSKAKVHMVCSKLLQFQWLIPLPLLYVDGIPNTLDFIGINCYGQEIVSGPGLKLVETDEYSGAPLLGFLFWTISDNWEWTDGFSPRFGLVAEDRANDLVRIPRPSHRLFTEVVTSVKVTREDREHAGNELQIAVKGKKYDHSIGQLNMVQCMHNTLTGFQKIS
ncbi:Beta-glucosidase-like SFR2 chloroplastic [Melia azedarach]|uniref:Beta-glucosidase-like SFR2 chloroplastic n=1 Tax=Melia azedarach TaxID=155640 RepID=A0ACC1YDS2_MELAZ|nr:Beta-glucosidase-like SFR2 chloroplastic [Melia azedarach]